MLQLVLILSRVEKVSFHGSDSSVFNHVSVRWFVFTYKVLLLSEEEDFVILVFIGCV